MLLTIFMKEFLDCLALKLKVLWYLERSVTTPPQTRRHIPIGHHKRDPGTISYIGSTVLMSQGPIIVEVPHTHSDTSKSVESLWTSDRPVAGTTTWQHTSLTRQRHSFPRWDSNPKSRQANGLRSMPWNSRPLESVSRQSCQINVEVTTLLHYTLMWTVVKGISWRLRGDRIQ